MRVWFLLGVLIASRAAAVELAANGKARWPVVVATNATEETRQRAAQLADYLGRIANAKPRACSRPPFMEQPPSAASRLAATMTPMHPRYSRGL